MEDNKFNKISLSSSNEIDEGSAYYAELKTLDFTPETKETEIKPKVKKGEWFWWKLFGVLPLVLLKAWDDLYVYEIGGLQNYTKDIIDYFKYKYGDFDYILKGKTVYVKATVKGVTHSGRCIERRFNSNEAAMRYFDYTKKMCIFYDNELK